MQNSKEFLGRMISILYRIGQSEIGKKLEPYNIGKGQFAFLAELLWNDGISQDEIASNFRCDKATAARAIRHLEQHGYVERKQAVDDGRIKLVFITDKAREFQQLLFSFLEEWTETLVQGFSADEKKTIFRLLSRSVENVTKAKIDNKE